MPSSTVENYVKSIYLLQQRGALVGLGELAAAVRVVPGTATTMVKALRDAGLVRYRPRRGVSLSPSGRRLALHILRRHRLIELFLVRVLGLDWSEVHDEAEELEHAVSDKVLERIDAMLGRPDFDPHGDPIPGPAGQVARRPLRRLPDCSDGAAVQVARIENQAEPFLRYVRGVGLAPGTRVELVRVDRDADLVHARVADQTVTLGWAAATAIWVQPAAEGGAKRSRPRRATRPDAVRSWRGA